MDLRLLVSDEPLSDIVEQIIEGIDVPNKSLMVPVKEYIRYADAIGAVPVDVKEQPDGYKFIIEMPGLKSADIKVRVEDDVLVISAERVRETSKGDRWVKKERRVGKLKRMFRLPENLNIDAISASHEDGVSTITIPKLPPQHKTPKITEVKFG